jgi:hypothetical protein
VLSPVSSEIPLKYRCLLSFLLQIIGQKLLISQNCDFFLKKYLVISLIRYIFASSNKNNGNIKITFGANINKNNLKTKEYEDN